MWEVMHKGGPMMYLMLLCSVIAVGVIIEKFYNLTRARIDTQKFMDSIIDVIKRNKIVEALEMCSKTPGPIAHIIKAGILKHDRSKPEIKEAIEEAGHIEIVRLEKNLGVLATIAHITPLLGLLGTVMGMIRAFQVIQTNALSMAPVNPGDLAGGIWESLLATTAGLAIAIPVYVAYNYFVNLVETYVNDMETASADLVNILTSRRDTYEV